MGSFNFNISAAAEKRTRLALRVGSGLISRHRRISSCRIRLPRSSAACASSGALGTRFEFECYDVGQLYNLAHFADRGLVKPPFFVQCIFGILGGIGAGSGESLAHARHRGPVVRQRLLSVGARRRAASAAVRHFERHPGRQCPGRVGGQPVRRQRQTRDFERGASGEDSPYPRGVEPGDRDARRRRARCSAPRARTTSISRRRSPARQAQRPFPTRRTAASIAKSTWRRHHGSSTL